MSGMLERTIFNILDAGREFATENSDFLVQFFCSLDLSEAEAEKIRTFWDSISVHNSENPSSPLKGVDIIHQFPRGPNVKFPCWAIVLMSEGEGTERNDRFLGDAVDDLVDENGLLVGSGLGSLWDSQHAVYVYAQSPDICIYYYELVRFFMTRARDTLKSSAGGAVLHSHFSGADMAPDPRYAPEHMFVRRFMIRTKKLQEVVSATQPARGTSVRGIYTGSDPESQINTDIDTGTPGVTVIEEDS